jgi:hypothetical protein
MIVANNVNQIQIKTIIERSVEQLPAYVVGSIVVTGDCIANNEALSRPLSVHDDGFEITIDELLSCLSSSKNRNRLVS